MDAQSLEGRHTRRGPALHTLEEPRGRHRPLEMEVELYRRRASQRIEQLGGRL